MARFVAISDTHTMHDRIVVPDADVLIVAGDFCGRGDLMEVYRFAGWLGELPHRRKLVIAGNHDWPFDRPAEHRIAVDHITHLGGAEYLQDSGTEVDSFKVWGSPWQPEFCNWAFNLPRGGGRIDEKCKAIPDDTQILITHGPPYGTLDATWSGVMTAPLAEAPTEPRHCGCERLMLRVRDLPDLRAHVFGHIHGSYGIHTDHHLSVNAAVCTERYQPINPPQVFELEAP